MKYVKIDKIRAIESKPVYHLTVEKNHNFFANQLCVHNCDYRGEYQMRFRALPESTNATMKTLQYPEFPFKVGDRVGQVYLEEVIPIKWEVVDELPDSHRGEGGFGSTGK